MKKVIFNRYGNADVLQVTETEIPAILQNEILVKVKAVSINPLDWKIFKGELKIMSGSKFPKEVGIDFSGIVEKTGSSVSKFKIGDHVFGLKDVFKGGALAEYLIIGEKNIAHKPPTTSFEQAAALPVVGSSALQILDTLVSVKPDTRILINGATGGIGTIIMQLVISRGAAVTAVTTSKGIEIAKRLGATEIIDYKMRDILLINKTFDIIIDLSGKLSFTNAKPLLNSQSTFISTIPDPLKMIGSFFNNIFSGKKYKVLVLQPTAHYLNSLSDLAENGLINTIDRTFQLSSVKQAYAEVMKGGLSGKAVITV